MIDYQRIIHPISEELCIVSQEIEKQLHSEVALINQVSNYIINSGGKRIRPALVLLVAKILGTKISITNKNYKKIIQMACVIEFIHTATLLHDDVVDESGLRRSKKTANSIFGSAASVLVGDFLYSRAFQIMVEVDSSSVMEIMANATNTIAEGEVLQLMNCNDPEINEERYLKVIRYKTSKLFEASCQIPPAILDLEEGIVSSLGTFGTHLGTAFQLTDDILDYVGSESEIGKKLGDDLREGKPTLPLIRIALNGDKETASKVKNAIKEPNSSNLSEIVHLVKNSDAIDYTKSLVKEECQSAAKCIKEFPDSQYKNILKKLLEFVVTRKN